MINSSLRLIFVLVYKSTDRCSESEKRKHFMGCFVLFNELLVLPWFKDCRFFANKFSCDQTKWGSFYSYIRPF